MAKFDLSSDSHMWGAITLGVYVAVMGVLVYVYYRDSKKASGEWADVRSKFVDSLGFSGNGKVHEDVARSVVADTRAATESDAHEL